MIESIYKSRKTEVFDLDDVSILKVTTDPSEYVLLSGMEKIPRFEYVCNYMDYNHNDGKYYFTKEKIEDSLGVQENIISLCSHWETYAETAYPLFDHIENYLRSNKITDYESQKGTVSGRRNMLPHMRDLFKQLVCLIEELRSHKIYNIDWHPGNFGNKNGHICLFELGGAKLLQ